MGHSYLMCYTLVVGYPLQADAEGQVCSTELHNRQCLLKALAIFIQDGKFCVTCSSLSSIGSVHMHCSLDLFCFL